MIECVFLVFYDIVEEEYTSTKTVFPAFLSSVKMEKIVVFFSLYIFLQCPLSSILCCTVIFVQLYNAFRTRCFIKLT